MASKKSNPYIELKYKQRLILGYNIRRERIANNMSQIELAETALGFERSHCFVSRVERGVLAKVPRARIKALAKALVVDVETLTGKVLAPQV